MSLKPVAAGVGISLLCASLAFGQYSQQPAPSRPARGAGREAARMNERIEQLSHEVEELKTLVHQLQGQIAAQPATVAGALPPRPPVAAAPAAGSGAAPAATSSAAAAAGPTPAGTAPAASPGVVAELLHGFTINALLDAYYEYNTNDPIGRVNYLRAYDVSSNSFSLSQADLMVESAPDPANGKREGMRIDLQFGQATSTLQGNPANELRPDIYRNIYQAYGTYVFPLGSGLTVDFGKWASSLGIEGNYNKDQLNYSRSFWFDFLPFYHMGVRAKYAINDEVAVNLWITNGTDQTEAFNNYKDQLVGVVITPTPQLSWTVNFYNGQEHPDVIYLQSPGPGQTGLPNQQGTYILPITNPPTGRLDILDSYVSWQATRALTLAAEGDYVRERLYTYSPLEYVAGGALYGGYQLTPKIAVAARVEYLADVGGLYSGVTQYLKEGTFTLDYRLAGDFLMRTEFRRDQSNRHYFLSDTLGVLESSQPTIGLGLVWWFGQKQGAW